MPMETQPMCSTCGTPLPTDAPEGLCPQCLVRAAFSSQTGTASTAHGTDGKLPVPRPEEIADQFPQLEILAALGQGGMGVVYKARQVKLDRIVALKILRSTPEQDPAFADRFAREARALAKLDHPHIVTVHDSGKTEAGLYYLLMEFVDGPDLRGVIQSRELSPQQALTIVPQICDALQYAHDRGVVHRDIKPENILLDREGRVKIADFGLAKVLGSTPSEDGLTKSRQVMGTPHYMAPEQFRTPQEVDHRADIYSLGVVLYEMLTGVPPMGHFPPPSQKVEVDVRLDEVVLKALDSEPELRYQHASDVRVDVETIVRSAPSGQPGSGPRRPPPPPSAHHSGARGWKSPVGCLVAVFVTVGVVLGSLVIISLLLPAFQRARRAAHVTHLAANLKQIGVALHTYALENDEHFPDDLGQLLDDGYTEGNVYVPPRSGTPQPSSGEDVRGGRCDLLYYGKGLTIQTCGPDTELVATKPEALRGHIAAIQGDGMVITRSQPGPSWGRALLFPGVGLGLFVGLGMLVPIGFGIRAHRARKSA